MKKELFVKIQYHNYEPGEFIDNKKISYEVALSLIQSFPWEEERRKFHVDLTTTSITFQTEANLFLKLALYYNGKFILYYYDEKHLYSHSFLHLEDSFPFIGYFFTYHDIDRSHYKLEPRGARKVKAHFISQDFIYSIINKSFFQSMDSWTRGLLLLDVVGANFLLIKYKPNVAVIIVIAIFVLMYGGINLLIHLNYYRLSKNETLVLSKGSDSFLFGKNEVPTKYFKRDIQQIIVEQNTGRAPWGGYCVTQLEMKNGEVLKIPSILLDGYEIGKKIPDAIHKRKAVFVPFM